MFIPQNFFNGITICDCLKLLILFYSNLLEPFGQKVLGKTQGKNLHRGRQEKHRGAQRRRGEWVKGRVGERQKIRDNRDT
jgi:hypothetical protein